MKILVASVLPAPASKVWDLVKRRETFLFITKGLLGLTNPEAIPEVGRLGMKIETRLVFFGFLRAWKHEGEIKVLDEGTRELLTHERGGPISKWHHRIRVEEVDEDLCFYCDEVEVEAGVFTPLVWFIGTGFYRYRQYRWRLLVG